MRGTSHQPLMRSQLRWLLATAAVSSGVGLAAELLLGTLASYLVGNQALAYGVAVGGFLAAMGLGAYLSRFVATGGSRQLQSARLLSSLLWVELAIAPLTAFLPLGLFALFVADGPLWLGLVLATLILGTLAGMEVPLLTRLVELDQGVREALAGVLALDYLGALAGSLLFPALLLPLLGLFPSAAVIGALPALMVFALGRVFPKLRLWRRLGLGLGIALLLFAPLALPVSNRLENTLYGAPVVWRQQSAYQRIVLTRLGPDVRLFLNGQLQLSTLDEYRYHEALVHPAMAASQNPRRVLVLGGGDGMALREIFKWPQVEQVLLIELDPQMVELARQYPALVEANQQAFADPRVSLRFGDAFQLLPQLEDEFDVILADFPDPDQAAIAKLYSQGFYRQIRSHLSPGGVFATQASSPFFAPKVMACIQATLAAAGLQPRPYLSEVPSFGPWGFVLGSQSSIDPEKLSPPEPLRYLSADLMPRLFALPRDVQTDGVQVNQLGHPVIVRYQADSRWQFY